MQMLGKPENPTLQLFMSNWYCIRTKRYKENWVAQQLTELRQEVYLPLLRERRMVGRRLEWVNKKINQYRPLNGTKTFTHLTINRCTRCDDGARCHLVWLMIAWSSHTDGRVTQTLEDIPCTLEVPISREAFDQQVCNVRRHVHTRGCETLEVLGHEIRAAECDKDVNH